MNRSGIPRGCEVSLSAARQELYDLGYDYWKARACDEEWVPIDLVDVVSFTREQHQKLAPLMKERILSRIQACVDLVTLQFGPLDEDVEMHHALHPSGRGLFRVDREKHAAVKLAHTEDIVWAARFLSNV